MTHGRLELSNPGQTFFSRTFLPWGFSTLVGIFTVVWVVGHTIPWAVPAGLLVADVIIIIWARTIRRVWMSGDELIIGHLIDGDTVPLSNLASVIAEDWNRTPSIRLRFSVPTKYGSIIRIVVPWDFGKKKMSEIETVLKKALLRATTNEPTSR